MTRKTPQRIPSLNEDERGATIVEFALALPLLATMMIGILQYALVLHASGAVRHALGEGIRYAKVYPEASEADVLTKTRNSMQGIDPSGIGALAFTRGVANNSRYGRLEVSYTLKPIIPFVAIPAIVIDESRQAYLPS